MAPIAETRELVCVGVVTGVRGIKGDIRVKSFTAEPEDLVSYGPLTDKTGTTVYTVKVTGTAKGLLITRFKGINDRTEAEKLKGTELFVHKDALPEPEDDEFYYQDLVGLKAELEDGSEFGTVAAVENFGAGDVLEITGSAEGTVMVPFTRDVVPVVDVKAGRLVINPPDGLMDPPEEEAKG
jgi:16S rRNA processing protein RimM